MEEIKVKEYVRTKNGKIRKIESTLAQYYITDKLSIMEDNQYELKDIVNHSFNIIDLIEERRLRKWKENRCNYRYRLEN